MSLSRMRALPQADFTITDGRASLAWLAGDDLMVFNWGMPRRMLYSLNCFQSAMKSRLSI
jgi:hypothetical protein